MPQMHKHPTSFQATNCVILNPSTDKILLGRKKNEKLWEVCGGFVDPKDYSLEHAVKRETLEETGLDDTSLTDPLYLFSFRVNDPNYMVSPDKIMSAVFLIFTYVSQAQAGDDIEQVKFFSRKYVRNNFRKMIVYKHHDLIEGLIKKGYL